MRALALASLLVLPRLAIANGGPVAWSSPSGRGDVAPTSVSEVRLVSETLRITLDAGGDRYAVDATYLLENASPRNLRVSSPAMRGIRRPTSGTTASPPSGWGAAARRAERPGR